MKSIRIFVFLLVVCNNGSGCISNHKNNVNCEFMKHQIPDKLLVLSQEYCDKYQDSVAVQSYLSQHAEICDVERSLIAMSVLFYRQRIEVTKLLLGSGYSKEKHLRKGTLIYVENEGWIFTFDAQGRLIKYVEE